MAAVVCLKTEKRPENVCFFFSFALWLSHSFPTQHFNFFIQVPLLYSWSFSQYNACVHWLIHGHMTSNKQTVSRQTSINGQHLRKRATFLTREYAKRNERVIGDDGKFTHSLAHSITPMWTFLVHSADQCVRLSWQSKSRSPKKGTFWKRCSDVLYLESFNGTLNRSADLKWSFHQRHAF